MNFQGYLLGGLLLSLPLASRAQAPGLPTTPHFYGGLGVYSSSHQNLGGLSDGRARVPVQAVVGYQLRPRLAVQLGVAYNGNRSAYGFSTSYSSYYPFPPNSIIDYAGTQTERSASVTALARYVLTRQATHRFQADLLGGAKFEYSHYRDEGSRTTHDQGAPVSVPYGIPSSYTQPLLSLGFGLRYRLVSQLEAAYDFTFDQPLGKNDYYSGSRLQATTGLGLRYHFGAR